MKMNINLRRLPHLPPSHLVLLCLWLRLSLLQLLAILRHPLGSEEPLLLLSLVSLLQLVQLRPLGSEELPLLLVRDSEVLLPRPPSPLRLRLRLALRQHQQRQAHQRLLLSAHQHRLLMLLPLQSLPPRRSPSGQPLQQDLLQHLPQLLALRLRHSLSEEVAHLTQLHHLLLASVLVVREEMPRREEEDLGKLLLHQL